jgi:signal transduction histidine kinase/ligand-binding sensor domain-containing protein
MKSLLLFSALIFLSLQSEYLFSQQSGFNLVLARDKNFGSISYYGTITDIRQDLHGYLWFSTAFKGLQRYDGVNLRSYQHSSDHPNSLSNNRVPCFSIDSSGIIWAATYGGGLDKFDPAKNTFVHFRHNPADNLSLANDTVFGILRDHVGNLWVGTYGGLDLLNEKTGKFTHYKNIPGDSSSLSFNRVWYLYEDREGTLWVGCGSPFLTIGEKPDDGGLNRFDRVTGKFVRYLHNPQDSNSISNNKVRAIFEDSKGNFWIGSAGDGLQTLDRKTGRFTHYKYDPAHPEKLSRPPLKFHELYALNHITFINEDSKGNIWIGSSINGVNKYDPGTKTIIHFSQNCFRAYLSRNDLMWFPTVEGDLYNINPDKKAIPYYSLGQPVNSIYYDEPKKILWIGSIGLMRKDLNNQTTKKWIYNPAISNTLPNDTITGMKDDGQGNLWIATSNGLCKFNRDKELFTIYKHRDEDAESISGNKLLSVFIDHDKNVWTSSGNWIIEKLDPGTGLFTHYIYNTDPNNLINENATCFAEDHNNNIWIGTRGLFKLDQKFKNFRHYLESSIITSICVDRTGSMWVGSDDGLYHYDSKSDHFIQFLNPVAGGEIKEVKNIMEDDHQNLWVSTISSILKINDKRNEVKIYGENFGVHSNTLLSADNYAGKDGAMFFADQGGYYSINSSQLKNNGKGPIINFTDFKIGNNEIDSEPADALKEAQIETKKITLRYNQNTFSIDFFAIDFKDPGEKKYLYMLENYDNTWHYIGSSTRASFFKVPPGKYIFRVKAFNTGGDWSEKTMAVTISPPWWSTWWAYICYAVLFIITVWGFIYFRSRRLRRENRVLEKRVNERTIQLQEEKQKVESALSDLKSTQAQLIQSEKMASLGELTAGIAHEIQNPLNFVNNFSEVSNELIDEMNEELAKGDLDEAKLIAGDIKQNLEKINHHGNRAGAIVKGMLQHSQKSTGQKEPTDINSLCDEYLRLSYHGFRAKDKSFSATMKTNFDSSIGKVNVIPQDIGRVVLNLINNAFYAVTEKKKSPDVDFEPTISVSTRKLDNKIEIKVNDNGYGIPEKIKDKIFQPFFTTKPTGEGTGLGLSLSYDIIKAHGGKINVETKEGEGSEFIIELPVI